MTTRYPILEPYAVHYLDVSYGHNLYVEEYGCKTGIPVIFIHGGPGPGCSPKARQFFDPKKFRVIFFDQRGAGKSTPLGKLDANTTAHILDDIECIRAFLNIEQWHIFGGSWGSTLALLYAQKHKARCLSLILRGIFLGTAAESTWYFEGVPTFFPELTHHTPHTQTQDIIDDYYDAIVTKNSEKDMARFLGYESSFSTLLRNTEKALLNDQNKAFMRILIHYFKHAFFIEENQILKNAAKLQGLTIDIVQGRYDIVCPIKTAYALHKALPQSSFYVIENAGHSSFEEGIALKLTELMDAKI